ncbi:MAG: PilZ domain-containing protein [Bacteriovoracaceae bacterium]|nr:PilZ domain-containing protein [Bacteriovoracaceae bacterium]
MVKFRDSYNDDEILNLFKIMKRNNEKLLIWQTHTVPRLKCEVRVDHIVLKTGTISFKPAYSSDDMFDFVSSNSLFVRADYKELLFKINRKTWSEGVDNISITIPSSVKVIEQRQSKRKQISANQLFAMKVIKKMTRGSQIIRNNFNMQMLDLSSGGACVLLSNSNASFFKKGDLFQVTDMGDMNIFNQVESEVAYVKDSPIAGYFRMGIQFKRRIENIEMRELKGMFGA